MRTEEQMDTHMNMIEVNDHLRKETQRLLSDVDGLKVVTLEVADEMDRWHRRLKWVASAGHITNYLEYCRDGLTLKIAEAATEVDKTLTLDTLTTMIYSLKSLVSGLDELMSEAVTKMDSLSAKLKEAAEK